MNELIKLPEIKTLTELVKHSNQFPTIRNSDKHEVEKAIVTLILEVFNFYNESPNDIQLKLMLPTLIEAMNRLTLPDIDIFKKNCLLGKYPLKYRLTAPVLIEWVKEYEFQRMEAFANSNILRLREIKEQGISEKGIEVLTAIGKNLKPTYEDYEKVTKTISPEMEQSKRLQNWIRNEFMELWKCQNKPNLSPKESFDNIPMVGYEGVPYLEQEYLVSRYAEIILQTKSNFEAIEKIINEK